MALAQEDIEFIKAHLGEWLAEQSWGKPPAVYEVELRERMVRVEEELKNQRELIKSILVQMDLRFQQVEKRFEQVDKRFEQADKRFEQMQQSIDARFEKMDRRFEQMQQSMDKRFEQVDKRFEQVDKRFEFMLKRHDVHFLWILGFIISSTGLVIAALKLL